MPFYVDFGYTYRGQFSCLVEDDGRVVIKNYLGSIYLSCLGSSFEQILEKLAEEKEHFEGWLKPNDRKVTSRILNYYISPVFDKLELVDKEGNDEDSPRIEVYGYRGPLPEQFQ